MVPSPKLTPADHADLFGQPINGNQPQSGHMVQESALRVMAEAGALDLMVGCASHYICYRIAFHFTWSCLSLSHVVSNLSA